MRSLDDFLAVFEFSEHHELDIDVGRDRIDRALREVTVRDMPLVGLLVWLRMGGRPANAPRPFLEQALQRSVLLDNSPGEGVVVGLTGRFWRFRDTRDPGRPRAADEFLAYDRADVCKAVIDFRIIELDSASCRLTTETRVHVKDPAARRAFHRYWFVIRPFSGLIRILFLRAVRRQALEM